MPQDNEQKTTPAGAGPQGGQNGNGQGAYNGNANGGPPPQNGNGNGQPQQQQGAPPDQNIPQEEPKKASFTSSPLFRILLVVVVIIAIIWGINYWRYSQNHVTTDDAYVTGDLVNISPIISGTLAQLNVDEGDVVKAGTVVAVLDPSGPRAAYQQAVAAYQAAQSQIPQAQTTYTYENASNTANIDEAEAAYRAQLAKTSQQQAQVGLIAATTQGQVTQASAQASAALAQADTANAQAISAQQAIRTAENAAAAAHQQVSVAQANYVRAQRDENRYAALYGPNGAVAAVTAQQLDQAVATADANKSTLLAVQDQAEQADSQVQQARAQAAAAVQTCKAAMQQYNAAKTQIAIAQANQIQVPVQRFAVGNNAAIAQQNLAEVQAAKAGSSQVTLRKQQVLTAQAQALQARAAMINAKVTLDDCTIVAPKDGTIVRKGANIGDALSPGQTIATLAIANDVWIEANFKETQLQYVRPGQPVDVTVDTFPGMDFHGKVQSINEASGNTVSLLPADNATGNFTKVVQRIPVKILLTVPNNPGPHDATLQDINNLRQGMSVETDIDVSSGRNNNNN